MVLLCWHGAVARRRAADTLTTMAFGAKSANYRSIDPKPITSIEPTVAIFVFAVYTKI